MKVLVVGANGQIGKLLVEQLQHHEHHTVRAMVRSEDQAKALEKQGIEAVVADLEGSVSSIAEAVGDCEAIVFTAGSGGSTGSDKTLLIDLDGAVKTVEAAEKAGVQRFVMVSALQAHRRENWSEQIKPYYVAKHFADRALTQSALDYTILRPGGLVNEPGTGRIRMADNIETGRIPRADVAAAIIAVLDQKNTFRRAVDLVSGDQSIQEAVRHI
ncbi:SDR family oxidoreductase [Paenibacillus sp. JX-17]|uniref:SDR family oxidoreductase n=1 Tax=Paenibacillus lacisoli TaxID=3064525 RepID=A0ABT9C8N7_9BACL|nr:SDR family oxidoreductase [Paenibacillus sp. JX-17]MDO7905609.1 SDR family oxidoreductase [Paenibacillus sp. JX-17]